MRTLVRSAIALLLATTVHAAPAHRLPDSSTRFAAPPGVSQAGPLVAPSVAPRASTRPTGEIRPLATSVDTKGAKPTLGGGGDGWGTSFATLGDLFNDGAADFVIGAPWFLNPSGTGGTATVYDGDPGFFNQTQTLRGLQVGEGFGYALAGVGDVNGDGWADLLVGAPYHTTSGHTNCGRAYLFLGGAVGYSPAPSWQFDTLTDQALVGYSVAWAGDVNKDGFDDWMVGAPYHTGGELNEGAVYLFYGGSGGLSNVPVWTQESNRTGANFGYSCAGAGDFNGDGYPDLVIGAPGDENPMTKSADEGAVYLFAGTAGTPSHTPSKIFYGQQSSAGLGASVAGVGDVDGDGYADVLAGAPFYSDDQTDEGIAKLCHGGPSFPLLAPPVVIQGAIATAQFGWSVGSAGDVNGDGYADFMIGAPNTPQTHGSGSAYLYYGRVGSNYPTFEDEFAAQYDNSRLGVSVGQLGDTNGDGRTEYATGEPNFIGPGIMFFRGGAALGFSFFLQFAGQGYAPNAHLGTSATTIDMDGDGYDDMVAGSPQGADDGDNHGLVAWYRGAPQPFPSLGPTPFLGAAPDWTYVGTVANSNAGWDVANAGDVNADGYEDLLIGGLSYTNGESGEGYATLVYGSASGPVGSPVWHVEGNEAFAFSGFSVTGGGDLDGDGYDDIAVGSPGSAAGGSNRGSVRVYRGSALGPAQVPWVVLNGEQDDANFGLECAIVGDIDKDGFDDLVVGAPYHADGEADEGRVLVYRGSPTGVHAPASQELQIDASGAQFGYHIARIGDVNFDGYADVAIGAPYYTNGETHEGLLSVFYGSSTGLVTPAGFVIEGEQVDANLGYSGIGAGGDYDGDGYGDLFVGMPNYDTLSDADVGRLTIYPGSPAGVSGVSLLDIVGGTAFYYLGACSGGAADFNGDGASDLWFTAPGYTLLSAGEGAIGVGYGNLFNFNAINPDRPGAAWRTDGSAPIALGLRSNANNAFALHGKGRSPAGRTKLRLEYEVKPQATPFDFTGRAFGPSQPTAAIVPGGGTTAPLSANVTGLATGTRYHWRARYRSASPQFPWTPWFGVERGSNSERMIVTGGAPGVVAVTPPAASGLALSAAAPNPFVSRVTLGFSLPRAGDATLALYDALGHRVRGLFAGPAAAGPTSAAWDGKDDAGRSVPSGTYFARLSFAGEERVTKVVRLR